MFCSFQSLWHIRRFREEFLRRSKLGHVHVGDPCVTCALFDIFSALSIASTDLRKEAVAPTSLRIALSNLYPESNFFQEVNIHKLLLSVGSVGSLALMRFLHFASFHVWVGLISFQFRLVLIDLSVA